MPTAALNKHRIYRIAMSLVPLVGFWGLIHQNMQASFALILGVIVFPFVVQFEERAGSWRYFFWALIPGILLLFVRANFLFYFFSIFFFFYVLEKWMGRINYLPLFLAGVVSPVMGNIVYTWSFPIRLQLSQWAGQALQWVGMNIQIHGNVIEHEGQNFSVDPACIGLKMVITSLVLCITIMGYVEKKYAAHLKFWKICGYLLLVSTAAIVANFCRLLLLIIFHILPDNPMHDVVGLLSMGVYVLLPFYAFITWQSRKQLRRMDDSSPTNIAWMPPTTGMLSWAAFGLLLCLQLVIGRQFLSPAQDQTESVADLYFTRF